MNYVGIYVQLFLNPSPPVQTNQPDDHCIFPLTHQTCKGAGPNPRTLNYVKQMYEQSIS